MLDDCDIVDEFVPRHFLNLLELFATVLFDCLQFVLFFLNGTLQQGLLVYQLIIIVLSNFFCLSIILLVLVHLF
jgi:hypothetical protein